LKASGSNAPDDSSAGNGIAGVAVRAVDAIGDVRGALCEIHRDEWAMAPRPVQWDFIRSKADVLRGVHVHRLRWDYFVLLEGQARIGLTDVRRACTFRRSMTIDIDSQHPAIVTVPPGVAHGVFAKTALLYLYGLSVAWDGNDEDLGCRYDDPALGVEWSSTPPLLLQRDLELPDFDTLVRQYEARTASAST
jgi:dTDP-4-dehydrorhamnose 3,5-epimerase